MEPDENIKKVGMLELECGFHVKLLTFLDDYVLDGVQSLSQWTNTHCPCLGIAQHRVWIYFSASNHASFQAIHSTLPYQEFALEPICRIVSLEKVDVC